MTGDLSKTTDGRLVYSADLTSGKPVRLEFSSQEPLGRDSFFTDREGSMHVKGADLRVSTEDVTLREAQFKVGRLILAAI